MTVSDLIAMLGQFPPDTVVVVEDSISPYVLDTPELRDRYHVRLAGNLRPCWGDDCPLCRSGDSPVSQVVLL